MRRSQLSLSIASASPAQGDRAAAPNGTSIKLGCGCGPLEDQRVVPSRRRNLGPGRGKELVAPHAGRNEMTVGVTLSGCCVPELLRDVRDPSASRTSRSEARDWPTVDHPQAAHFDGVVVQFKTMVIGVRRSASRGVGTRKRPSLLTAYGRWLLASRRAVGKSFCGTPALEALLRVQGGRHQRAVQREEE